MKILIQYCRCHADGQTGEHTDAVLHKSYKKVNIVNNTGIATQIGNVTDIGATRKGEHTE